VRDAGEVKDGRETPGGGRGGVSSDARSVTLHSACVMLLEPGWLAPAVPC